LPVENTPRILFVRGGPGTGGFLEGGSDEQLSSISNSSTSSGNHGWATLASELRDLGFELDEQREEPVTNGVPTPLPFDEMDLSVYTVIVMGSNNAAYTSAQVDALEGFLRDGGGVLFISDANFGQDWPDAPTSDQSFLDRLGLVMNQDRGTYSISESEYRVNGHPILDGVSEFDGEGVSPVTIGTVPGDVRATLLANAEGRVRRNDSESGKGTTTDATEDDAALLVGTAGDGRFAVHFDRNTFFNENGAGTDITRFDNRPFARNLFRWLAGDLPLPVDLNGFDASFRGDSVTLTWNTASETDHAGFGIERRREEGPLGEGTAVEDAAFEDVAFVSSPGPSSDFRAYRYVDRSLPSGFSPLVYRLRIVGTDGTVEYSSPRLVTRPVTATRLHPVSPSPLHRPTTVSYVLATAATVDLSLFDVLGRLVHRIRSGPSGPGYWQAPLRTDALPAGRYFLRLTVDGTVHDQSFTVVR